MRNQQVYLIIYSFCAVIYKAKIEQCIQKFPENFALATEKLSKIKIVQSENF